MVIFWKKKRDDAPESENDTEYHVKVDDYKGGEFNLMFNTRQSARNYKKAIKESKSQLSGRIIKRVYAGKFIESEEEVW